MKPFFAGAGAVLLLIILAGVAVSLGGVFDVRATTSENAMTRWFLQSQRERSLARLVEAPDEPDSLKVEEMLEVGASHYDAMCAECHAVPGRQSTEIAKGLNPPPPDLAASFVQERTNAELYWIVANGFKMTGMPAFAPTHDSSEIWAIVAFVRELPELDADSYAEWTERGGSHEHHGEMGEHHDEEDAHHADAHHHDDDHHH